VLRIREQNVLSGDRQPPYESRPDLSRQRW